jgi:hypothetical protein
MAHLSESKKHLCVFHHFRLTLGQQLLHGRELSVLATEVELFEGQLDILDGVDVLEAEANLYVLADFDFIERLDFDAAGGILQPGGGHVGILQINRFN